MPNRRMRWPCISIVSPSMTEARPTRSVASAVPAARARKATNREAEHQRSIEIGHTWAMDMVIAAALPAQL